MRVKVGNFIFVLESEENIYRMIICTSDGVYIISINMSETSVKLFMGLLNNIAIDMESGFVNIPLASSKYKYTVYVNRDKYRPNVAYIRFYKTDIMTSHDEHILTISTDIESREIENLYRHLSNLIE